jgi:DNA-binding Lrp family transcriptional regulator
MRINGIDEKDNEIVNLLLQDSRMSYSEIGERIGMTHTSVRKRIANLEKNGIIKGYSIIVDPQMAPRAMTFIATVETEPAAYDEITEILRREDVVVTLCQIAGDCCLHAICVADSLQEMRDFAKRMRNAHVGLKRFSANTVLEVMKGNVLPE